MPSPASPLSTESSAAQVADWLDALVDDIAALNPEQRGQLWRRLQVTGLLPSVGPVTDRGRLGVARAVAEETALSPAAPPSSAPILASGGQFVSAQPPPSSAEKKTTSAQPLPESASIPLNFRPSVSGKVVLGSSKPKTEMRPHEMSPLPGQAPESPILLFVAASNPANLGHSHGSYTLAWPGRAEQVVRLRFGEQATNLTEAAYDTLIAGLEAIVARLAEGGATPTTARLHLTSDTPALLHQITGTKPCPDPLLQARRNKAQAILGQFGSWRAIDR